MTPAEVRACSMWEFQAAVDGWVAAHAPDTGNALSEAEKDELWAAVLEKQEELTVR